MSDSEITPEAGAVEIAQHLIQCPSVTPVEGGALDYLETLLTNAGFRCSRLVFSSPGMPDVANLHARIGSSSPHVCFAGHTDVVPPGDASNWTYPPFEARIANAMLFGRGAADMKGGVAASAAAVLAHLEKAGGQPSGSISFLITGDEEGPAVNGTVKVVDWMMSLGERPDYCLLPECTSEAYTGDTIKIGRRGSLNTKLTVRGTQGHVAYPQKANNPLPRLVEALSALLMKPLDDGSEHFQPSNLEVTSIDTGNPTSNLIPAGAGARFNIRFNNHHTVDSLKRWIEQQVSTALLDTGVSYELEYEAAPADCFFTEPGNWVETLVAAVEAETGKRPAFSTAGGTSDARFIKDLCPVVEIGLLNATAHKIDEHVPVADVERLARIFERFLDADMPPARG